MQLDSFRIEYIPQKVTHKTRDKSISLNIFKIQDNDSFMCGFYSIAFIEYMLSGKKFFIYITLIYVLLMTIKRMTK